MPEPPDPDPLAKAIGMLRTGVDELARLSEHPMVRSVLTSLISTLREDNGRAPEPPPPARATPPPEPPPPASPTAVAAPRPVGRRGELLAIIQRNPGTSIAAAARELEISAGGLYPVARKLEADGLIRKDGTGWHATG